MGHEDQFPPLRLSARCRLDDATFAGMGGKEEDAPKTAIHTRRVELAASTLSGSFTARNPVIAGGCNQEEAY
jgi:hypothetical protein